MRKTIAMTLIMLLSIFGALVSAKEQIQVKSLESTGKVTVHSQDETKALVSVLDAQDKPVLGLKQKDFTISKGGRIGKVLSVSPLESNENVPLNVVLVIDNSLSMKKRKAVDPLLNALNEFFSIVRPIDNIHAVVFDDNETTAIKGYTMNARTLQSNDVTKLRSFFNESFRERLTKKTYLYDSMLLGLDIIRRMPEDKNKFLLVFTDGQDINSQAKTATVEEMAEGIANLSVYALDFTEDVSEDYFLKNLSEAHSGRIWKAESSAELVPIFESFSNSLRNQYVLTYRFINPPQGTLAFEPKMVTIREITTIDSSPLLNYVFFEEGKSKLSGDYVLFSEKAKTQQFKETDLGGSMEKYRNILNILGKRLKDNPGAGITIVGCNSDQGIEKSNIALSRSRAEAVQGYLTSVWGIDPSRTSIQARNRPAVPSASTATAGIAENQRVEIHSDRPEIFDIVKSTYLQKIAEPEALRLQPQIQAEAGVASWKVELRGGDNTVIESASGKGDMTSAVTFNLVPAGLSKIASFKTLTADVEVTDNEGVAFKKEKAATTNVQFIKREEQLTEKKGNRVLERYALILFEYDKAQIKEHNRAVIDRIVARMKERPSAKVRIVGHTDTLGKENYNMRLSERRAKAVYDQIMASGFKTGRDLTYTGAGPHHPLYDNAAPEGRALNRTVTVTLEYEEKS